MATKKKTLELARVVRAIDLKNYEFYNTLTEQEQKEFSPYVMMGFTASVKGDADLQEWFLEMTNEVVNKRHWSLSASHKALHWKLLAAIGVGSNLMHPFMLHKNKKADKIEKLLAEIHPAMKLSDIKVLAGLMNKQDIDQLFDDMGFDKKQRKEYE